MGADMMLSTLWRKREEGNKIDVEVVLEKMLEVLKKETDKDTFIRAFAYGMGQDGENVEPLVADVLQECRTQDSGIQETYDTILKTYKKDIENIERSLQSREVAEIWLPGLIGYATGGVTWGDDTATGYLWSRLLFETDPGYARHPYADQLYDAIFTDPGAFYKEQTKTISDELEKSQGKLSTLMTILEDESFGETDILVVRNTMRSVILG